MADQKSRGGQKRATGKQPGGGQHRHAHPREDEPRREKHMKEDAARGKQGQAGGDARRKPRG